MGVLTCSRGNCERIMCNRYSSKYGYICADCFEELINLGETVNIERFMVSDVGVNKLGDTYPKWDEEFQRRDF